MHSHNKKKSWQTQKAKAEFSRLIQEARKSDQEITLRGEPIAFVISKERYDELTKSSSSLIDFFKQAPLPDVDIDTKRSRDLPRKVDL